LIDVTDGPECTEQVTFWSELEGTNLRLHAGDEVAPARLMTCRPEDRCAGAAHWVTFVVTGDGRDALADQRRAAFVGADYKTYQHRSSPLSDAVRRSLLDDLGPTNRGLAA
jgi:hypothetical protein